MFTFANLFAAAAMVCVLVVVLHLFGGGGLVGALFWTLTAVVFACAHNACKGKKG